MEASRRLDAETWSDPDVARRLSEATVALRLSPAELAHIAEAVPSGSSKGMRYPAGGMAHVQH